MEKQRINRASRFIKGLLTALLLTSLFSSSIFAFDKEDGLYFTPSENQEMITESDIKFEILIPKVSSKDITILEDMNQKKGERIVSFLSLKKYDDLVEEGTRIEISYNFKKKGEFTLYPLIAEIKGKTVKIEFSPVTIKNNPLKMVPTLVIIFSNGIQIDSENTSIESPIFTYYMGDKLGFTVYLQYASSLTLFNYDIPQNSIYNETKTYDIINKETKINTISDDLIPIADFQWTSLKADHTKIPSFKVSAEGYDGKKYDIVMPEIEINFISKPLSMINKEASSSNIFNDSFASIPDTEKKEEKIITIKDCETLASLYSKERNSVFSYFSARKERIDFEESLGLMSNNKTVPLFYIYLSIILILAFGFLLFLSIKKKYFFKTILSSILVLLSITSLIFTATKRSTTWGISKGCTIYSIPESNATAAYEIKSGTAVGITETTDIWYHIQQGEASGWSLKDNIIIVK